MPSQSDELLESVAGQLEPGVVFKSDGGPKEAPADEQPEHLAAPVDPTSTDTLYDIHTALADELCALRCAYGAIDRAEDAEPTEDLSAARNLLSHSLERLDRIVNRLDLVDVRSSLTPKGRAQS